MSTVLARMIQRTRGPLSSLAPVTAPRFAPAARDRAPDGGDFPPDDEHRSGQQGSGQLGSGQLASAAGPGPASAGWPDAGPPLSAAAGEQATSGLPADRTVTTPPTRRGHPPAHGGGVPDPLGARDAEGPDGYADPLAAGWDGHPAGQALTAAPRVAPGPPGTPGPAGTPWPAGTLWPAADRGRGAPGTPPSPLAPAALGEPQPVGGRGQEITISIGHIEVRVAPQAQPQPPPARSSRRSAPRSQPLVPLADFLQRHGDGRR